MSLPPVSVLARDACLSLAFFTRLPVPLPAGPERSPADSLWAAPLAGLAVALTIFVVHAALALSGVWEGPAAAIAIVTGLIVTGCLHEDGLADTADGFGGGRTRERKLEIMRDSRIGTYGTAAIGASLLVRWSALAELDRPIDALFALVAAHMASRALLPALLETLPAARGDGLGAGAAGVSPGTAAAALGLGAVGLLALGPGGALAAAVWLAVAFFAFRRLCLRQIGGGTGDTAGAMQQIGEAIVLVAAAAYL